MLHPSDRAALGVWVGNRGWLGGFVCLFGHACGRVAQTHREKSLTVIVGVGGAGPVLQPWLTLPFPSFARPTYVPVGFVCSARCVLLGRPHNSLEGVQSIRQLGY